MKILDRAKLEEFLQGCAGEGLAERLQDFCRQQAVQDPSTSPSFERIILAPSGLIAYLYGENQALLDRLKGLEWRGKG